MTAPFEQQTSWPLRHPSHWTRDGRFHAGDVEACEDCNGLPDLRTPRAADEL